MLSACLTQPIRTETKLELTPDNLMVSPCDAVSAGTSVESLARGYMVNTRCVRTHQKLLEEQRKYKKQVQEVYAK